MPKKAITQVRRTRSRPKQSKAGNAQPKAQPVHLTGRKPVRISVAKVMKVLKMIDDNGHADRFQRASRKTLAYMTIHRDTVNFVKDFVANNNLHTHPLGARVVRRCRKGDDPFDCDFGP